MNLKALVTSIVLSSSTMVSAGTFSLSGSVSVGVSNKASVPNVRAHESAYQGSADSCTTSPRPASYDEPVWFGSFYEPTNVRIGVTSSYYTGPIATSNVQQVRRGNFLYATGRNADWFDLTEATRIDNDRESFKIGSEKGLFQALLLQGLGNRSSHITQVWVDLIGNNGKITTQKVRFDNTLDSRHPITIDLDGNFQSIYRIVVFGSTEHGAAYKILAK